MTYKYEIEKNPRKDKEWEDMDKRCLFCNKVATRFVRVENYRVCTTCLYNSINDVHKSILEDVK